MARLNLPKPRLFLAPASPLKRALAFMIDILIIDFVLMFPFQMLFEKKIPGLEGQSFSSLMQIVNQPEYYSLFIASAIAMGMLAILYFASLEYALHQTIGKMIMNMSVVSDIKERRFWQYLVRNMLLIPVFPIIVMWAADIVYIFFNSKRQRLLEVLSKTRTTEIFVGV
jgi:uncharacterized RDD family membrane protein YckC